jgi:hypothetical protein
METYVRDSSCQLSAKITKLTGGSDTESKDGPSGSLVKLRYQNDLS